MIDFASILSSPVISRDSCQIVGRIKTVYLSQKHSRIAYFGVENADKNELLVPFDDALCFNDAVVVQNCVNAKEPYDVDFTVLSRVCSGMPVYTQTGILKGHIESVSFSANGKISSFDTDKDKLPPSAIQSVGDVILLKGSKTKKGKKQAIPRPASQTKVTILKGINEEPQKTGVQTAQNADFESDAQDFANTQNNEDTAQNATPQGARSAIPQSVNSFQNTVCVTDAPCAVALSFDAPMMSQSAFEQICGVQLSVDDAHTPTRVISDYSFLLGRTLTKDLSSFAGTPIALAGDEITDEIVNKARLHGKLVDLAINSLENK